MQRLLVTLFLATTMLFAPLQTEAANLNPIVPDCDQTEYRIKQIADPYTEMVIPADLYDTTNESGVKQYAKENWSVINYSTSEHCGFDSFLELFVNLFNWGLYILSVLALFFFFLGGGTLMLSGGSEERVRTGKAILVNTVIGLGIALSSWVIVNLTINTLRPEGEKVNGIAVLFNNQPWFRVDASTAYVVCTDPPTALCKNSSRVRETQEKLVAGLCYADNSAKQVDGNFGPKTLAAWNKWQIANGAAPTNTIDGEGAFTKPCIVIDVTMLP